MKYALGNMLNGAGGLNADQLALDLPFAVTKSLIAAKGPTPTFTRASSGTFVGSNGLIQSAGNNVARFDHDPVTLASMGLLIEESRTNLILQSEDANSATWQKINGTISNNYGTSPSGVVNADKFVEDTGLTGKYFRQTNLITITNATVYTFSVYAKADGRNFCSLSGDTSNGFLGIASFDLLNGNVGAVTAGASATIRNAGNGWYRLTVTSTSTGTSIRPGFFLRTNSAGTITQNYQGDGVSGVLFWGAQLEAGSFATSYIPTTTTSVVRSADVCSISGTDFSGMYNQPEGTILVNAFTPASGDRTIFAVDDNTANEMIRLRTEGTNPFFKVTDGGSESVAIDSGTVVANTSFKLAGAYKLNDFASSINGGAAVTDTSGTIPTVDRMRIGAGQGGNTMCGCVASLRYYKKRLPDAKLVTLTA